MATAKKVAPKSTKSVVVKTAPVKTAPAPSKPAAKKAVKKAAPVSKAAKAIASINAKLAKANEKKEKIVAEITALKDQRAALKASNDKPAATPVAAPATKQNAKPAAKAVKAAAKK